MSGLAFIVLTAALSSVALKGTSIQPLNCKDDPREAHYTQY